MIEIKKRELKELLPDATDVFTFFGICLIGIGTWWISPPISLIVVGSLLLVIALAPHVLALIKPGK
ncbi:hypothetical protein [Desulfosporosinus fructosivorans]